MLAPLRVPVEIRLGSRPPARWFRYAAGVSEGGLAFVRPLPEELDGAVDLAFQLPDDPLPITVRARLATDEERRDEEGRRVHRALRFIALDEASRARIAGYVEARVPA